MCTYLDLLIIPVVLAVGGFLFTRSENRATQAAAERRAQEEALQAYLSEIGNLLLEHNLRHDSLRDSLRDSESNIEDDLTWFDKLLLEHRLRYAASNSEASILARARTLTVLSRLDGDRKRRVVQFLRESGLIDKNLPIVDMKGVDLSYADLRDADLSYVDLCDADLRGANLRRADLHGSWLENADLSEADLSYADLRDANLIEAKLRGAKLIEARLRSAHPRPYASDSSFAELSYADLSCADLSRAKGWDEDMLRAASSLEGATMPDSQILKGDDNPDGPTFENWLKSRGEQNSGP